MRISVFGLGYVGAVSVGCLARDGHSVVGVDIDAGKLELIRNGNTPIIEAGMTELMEAAAGSGRVTATEDAAAAVHGTDVSFVCVGTPSQTNGGQDLSAIVRLSEQLGDALKTKEDYHVVVIRSTVVPGTTDETIKPILEKRSNKVAGEDFGLCFQPEFLREGASIRDYDNPPYTVVGSNSDRATEVVRAIFGHLPCEFLSASIRTAEMIKYCCNVFHALKITFANEVGRICQSVGVASHDVMDMVCKDTHLNISPAYMRPGFAFGGSCLPKDLRALMRVAHANDVHVPMLSGIMPSNRAHIDHAIEKVLSIGKRSVGMIGLSFKSGTDDLRESPLVSVVEHFIGKGLRVGIYDPEVNLSRLVGANRRYIEESIPHIASLMKETCAEVVEDSEIVIVGLNDPWVGAELRRHARDDHIVIDLVGLSPESRSRGTYWGVAW